MAELQAMREQLEEIRDWAKAKLQGESEPPWAWYQYMKLIEVTDAILEGMASATERLQRSELHREMPLRLVADSDQQDTSQSRPSDEKPPLPM